MEGYIRGKELYVLPLMEGNEGEGEELSEGQYEAAFAPGGERFGPVRNYDCGTR